MRIILAQPRGFCAGVVRAIEIVERALEAHAEPVYVRHEIVHNRRVVEELEDKGARFVEELDEIPDGAVTIFSAHGASPAVAAEARRRRLPVLDATCPLVAKVHQEGRRYASQGRSVVLIGHADHPEVVATHGQIAAQVAEEGGRASVHIVANPAEVARLPIARHLPVAYVTQTTLSVDDTRGTIAALRARFPDLVGPDTRDICYATQNRQSAVRALAAEVDVLLVVGAANSSNSNRLREIGAEQGVPCYLLADAAGLRPEWVADAAVVGITAGASAPESLVQEVVAALGRLAPIEVTVQPGLVEDVQFKLPAQLSELAIDAAC